jgi:hypothetical protein
MSREGLTRINTDDTDLRTDNNKDKAKYGDSELRSE